MVEISDIVKLTNLTLLGLKFNEIKELPDDIDKLVNLKEFFLGDNFLKRVPKTISNITSLGGNFLIIFIYELRAFIM